MHFIIVAQGLPFLNSELTFKLPLYGWYTVQTPGALPVFSSRRTKRRGSWAFSAYCRSCWCRCCCIFVLPTFPDQLSNEVCLPENLIHNQAKVCYFDIINADENNAIIRQQLQARIHHAQPLVVADQCSYWFWYKKPSPAQKCRKRLKIKGFRGQVLTSEALFCLFDCGIPAFRRSAAMWHRSLAVYGFWNNTDAGDI